jgi:hypothetical protein
VTLLPLLVGVIIVMHVIMVRRHGVVPPIDAELADVDPEGSDGSDGSDADRAGGSVTPRVPAPPDPDAQAAVGAPPLTFQPAQPAEPVGAQPEPTGGRS